MTQTGDFCKSHCCVCCVCFSRGIFPVCTLRQTANSTEMGYICLSQACVCLCVGEKLNCDESVPFYVNMCVFACTVAPKSNSTLESHLKMFVHLITTIKSCVIDCKGRCTHTLVLVLISFQGHCTLLLCVSACVSAVGKNIICITCPEPHQRQRFIALCGMMGNIHNELSGL